jgi:hypothetical protein
VYRAIFGILVLIAATSSVLGNLGVADHSKPLLVIMTSLFDALIVVTLTRTFIVTEYRLRALGGKMWSHDDMPRLVSWLRFDQQLLEICESAPLTDLERPG